MNISAEKIHDRITKKTIGGYENNPLVYIFDTDQKELCEEAIALLKNDDYKFVDVNQCGILKPEDFEIKLADAGFDDKSGVLTMNDILDDATKKRWIVKTKLANLQRVIDDHTVLLITYNDLYLQDVILYETVRRWLKDGYIFDSHFSDIPVNAFILLETDEKIRDFCKYGIRTGSRTL